MNYTLPTPPEGTLPGVVKTTPSSSSMTDINEQAYIDDARDDLLFLAADLYDEMREYKW